MEHDNLFSHKNQYGLTDKEEMKSFLSSESFFNCYIKQLIEKDDILTLEEGAQEMENKNRKEYLEYLRGINSKISEMWQEYFALEKHISEIDFYEGYDRVRSSHNQNYFLTIPADALTIEKGISALGENPIGMTEIEWATTKILSFVAKTRLRITIVECDWQEWLLSVWEAGEFEEYYVVHEFEVEEDEAEKTNISET